MHSNKRIYPFVDFIRFFSMAGIVWAHTDVFPGNIAFTSLFFRPEYLAVYIGFKQIFKFSVISFFMISGILLADQLKVVKPITFLIRRLQVIIIPYLISFSIYLIFLSIYGDVAKLMKHSNISSFKIAVYILFYSPYWYIPVYLIALIVILVFHKFVNKIWFGSLLLLITIFYTFSPSSQTKDHTTAFFAFAFYVWLGILINEKKLIDKIKKWRIDVLIGLIVAAFVLASKQSYALLINHNTFYFNNLRFFNQIYGVLVFCLLIRICPEKPSFFILKPRQETYGIYLYHIFFVMFLVRPIIEWMNYKGWYPIDSFWLVLLIFIIQFILCYILTTAFIKILHFYRIPVLGIKAETSTTKSSRSINSRSLN
ncbi:acyltransferase family protein [Dyadobacter subterraneus]|uniref:Acyltransferase n=1 Tax=Dyadobacter subterraneus TaxID=2773304 RepID=A0ABR9WA46_9BACT|nr:acyltransferase [Dyadobacter subterraneus]